MEYGKKKKMMYGGMAKKKMYGGGMTKKKKMKDGGMAEKKMTKPAKPAKPAGRPKKKSLREIFDGPPIDPNTGKPMQMAKKGGMMKPVDKEKNPGLAKLPKEVRNKMGFMKKGGMAKKKMMSGGMTIKKMKHGGKAGKCPRDGIAMKGKTRAGRK